MTRPFDVAVIGGGIVGLASARAIGQRSGSRVVVLEAEDALARHQTGNNSGVLHSGLSYRPGSHKARNCVRGRLLLEAFCERHGIRHERCGKLVVATRPDELPRLDALQARGEANGLSGLVRLGPEQIKEREPHVTGLGALLVPETGIVDFVAVCAALAQEISRLGGEVRLGHRLLRVLPRGDELVLETTGGELTARALVNCAGLQSDRVARLAGIDPVVRIVPFRGEYYELTPGRQHLVRGLVYPVPDPAFPFLGVHFTRTVAGLVEAGPNAVLALKREGYRRGSFSPRDAFELVTFGGFWRLAKRHWRMGLGELWRSWSKRAFVAALERLVPELTVADVHRGGAGVRAQALGPDGSLLDDFRIVEAARMIHVLNAPSPAATASLAIGESIADLAERRFNLPTATAR